jgi:hypothetical protein
MKRSVSANSLPSLSTPTPCVWDLTESSPFVPVNTLVKCGSVHSFPVSLLSSDDTQEIAVCLATPSTVEEDARGLAELERAMRKALSLNHVCARRRRLQRR